MVAPLKNLTEAGPFPLEQTTRHFGGKLPLTDEEREWRSYEAKGRGSGHGRIEYDPWGHADKETIELYRQRLAAVTASI